MLATELRSRHLSLALRLYDAVTRQPLSSALVTLGGRHVAQSKADGFYTTTNIQDGTHEIVIEASGYQRFVTNTVLPMPAMNDGLFRDPGENDLLLSVKSVDRGANSVRFAARNVPEPLPIGTLVLAPRRFTTTTGVVTGMDVINASLLDVGIEADPTRIKGGDLLRFERSAVIHLRPAASYPFPDFVRRLTGRVLDSIDGEVVAGATVRIFRLNGKAVTGTNLGPVANRARVFRIGTTNASRRVIGTRREVASTTDERGSFALSFLPRRDLAVQSLRIRISAPGYTTFATPTIDISASMANNIDIQLVRS